MPHINNFNPNGGNNMQNPNGRNPNNGNPNGGNPNNPVGIGIPMTMPAGRQSGNTDIMDLFINYNEKFKTYSTCMFRDEVIQQLISILIAKKKPNALLVGSAGVGKTNIVEHLAHMIVTKNTIIPKSLSDCVIYELPLSNIVAGSGIVGELESKMQEIIEFAENPKNHAILFIDEIHQLLSNHGGSYEKIAQMLKPAMARGNMRVIGATTLQESQNFFKDPAFARRFTRLLVDELSREQTIEILKSIKGDMFSHYNNFITIDDTLLESIAIYADEYQTSGSHRPDNAITLFDRAMGDTIVRHNVLLEQAKADPIVYQTMLNIHSIALSEQQVERTAIRLMTGNNKQTKLDINHLKESMSVIKGQDNPIKIIIDALQRYNLSLYPKKKPLTFLFAGTTGVGKTEIAKIIAKELTGMKPIIMNMTEYHSSASINRIIGAPAGYVGSDSNQELPFDCLETNPYQVILLDEFEKCDKSVQRLFMSAFEEGNMKTNRGKDINFSKAIIIVTTNAAHTGSNKPMGFATNDQTDIKTEHEVAQSLINDFDAELINRIEHPIEFNEINKEIYTDIMRDKYERDIARIKSEHRKTSLPDTLDDATLQELVEKSFAPEFGARPVEKTIRQYIEDKTIEEQTNCGFVFAIVPDVHTSLTKENVDDTESAENKSDDKSDDDNAETTSLPTGVLIP